MMTMTQKILAAHAGLPSVTEGQLIEAELDMVLANDITAPVAIREMERVGGHVRYRDRVALVMDHFTPNKDIKAACQVKYTREFAAREQVEHFFDVGQMGIEHALLPEQGLVGAGDCVIGADSHTCTYGALGAFSTGVGSTDLAAGMMTAKCWFKVPAALRFVLKGALPPFVTGKDLILHIIGMIGVDGALYKSMEFTGEGVASLSMDDRFTVCNMAIEAGAKNGIFPVDERALAYMKDRFSRPVRIFEADADAKYEATHQNGVGGHPRRSGGHRLLHQRAHLRSAAGGRGPEGPQGREKRALHRHPRDAGSLPAGDARGAFGDLCTRGRRGLHADVRTLPGRTHGHPCRTRAVRLDDQPQLCGTHGTHDERGLPRLPLYGGGERGPRQTCHGGGGHEMIVKGKVHRYASDVDTDVIIPARYLNTSSAEELAAHCMEDIDPDFVKKVQKGDIIVAEDNFGCGSSREHAPLAIKASGVSLVIANTFARIFYRNAINIGLPILECPAAVRAIKAGDVVSCDLAKGVIRNETTGETFTAQPFPPFIQNIIDAGGLLASLQK